MSALYKLNMQPASEPRITVCRSGGKPVATKKQIVQAVRHVLGNRRVESLNIAVVDDPRMADLHLRFMGDPSPTDVLTFDLRDDPQSPDIQGEIVVSADTARREARRRKLDESQELLRYVIHGVLHLLGLDDRTVGERRKMRREETRVLKELGMVSTPRPRPRKKDTVREVARKHR